LPDQIPGTPYQPGLLQMGHLIPRTQV
jgi:hypothetical protein